MARINLLPWRAERRRQRQKEFLAMLAFSGVLALALSFIIISFYNGQITGQNERIGYLKKQISDVDAQIKEIEVGTAKETRITLETGTSTVVVERSRIVRVGAGTSIGPGAPAA